MRVRDERLRPSSRSIGIDREYQVLGTLRLISMHPLHYRRWFYAKRPSNFICWRKGIYIRMYDNRPN
jgi:hypothetical protein